MSCFLKNSFHSMYNKIINKRKVVNHIKVTITAKIKITPTYDQIELFKETVLAYRKGCNFVSRIVFDTNNLKQTSLHKTTYHTLRSTYHLRSQMAQSVMKTVIAKYKTNQTNNHEWSQVQFKKPEYDLVWNRDYSLTKDVFSVNTLQGRIKVPFEIKGMEQYFDGSWSFGTAKLVNKYKKWFLHIPMTKEMCEMSEHNINQVVGIDFGINFVATSYDSNDLTSFFNGKEVKHKRAKYKHLRKQLQMKQTPSARRRLKAIGDRENRWMTDMNHSVSKALVSNFKIR